MEKEKDEDLIVGIRYSILNKKLDELRALEKALPAGSNQKLLRFECFITGSRSLQLLPSSSLLHSSFFSVVRKHRATVCV